MDLKFLKVYSPKRKFLERDESPRRTSPQKMGNSFDWIYNLIHPSSQTLDLQQKNIF